MKRLFKEILLFLLVTAICIAGMECWILFSEAHSH